MDVNREINEARRTRHEREQQAEDQRNQRASWQREIDEICSNFVRWARESGTPTNASVTHYGDPVRVGRGRKARMVRPSYSVGVWAIDRTVFATPTEDGFGESITPPYIHLAIDQNGKLYPEEKALLPPPPDLLMFKIVRFIAEETSSTLPWPE